MKQLGSLRSKKLCCDCGLQIDDHRMHSACRRALLRCIMLIPELCLPTAGRLVLILQLDKLTLLAQLHLPLDLNRRALWAERRRWWA